MLRNQTQQAGDCRGTVGSCRAAEGPASRCSEAINVVPLLRKAAVFYQGVQQALSHPLSGFLACQRMRFEKDRSTRVDPSS